LDGLRGLAALLVVYHHQHLAGISDAPPAAYLAVDLFFLMSGFVIAHAYEGRLGDGMAPLYFMRLRLVRLYPLYILGSALGLGVALAFWRLSGMHPATPLELVRATASALAMLPYFDADPSLVAFPLNGPAWSLFFELGVNLVYAAIAVRLSSRALAGVCVGCAVLLAVLAARAGNLNLGIQSLGFLGGAPRVAFSFFGGVLIYRLYRQGRAPRIGASPLWALVLGLALLCAPSCGAFAVPVALGEVLIGFPVVLWLAVGSTEPPDWLARGFALAGEASYPLYAIHGPIVVGLMMASRFWNWPLTQVRLEVAFALPLVLAAAALWLSRAYDRPVRAFLTRSRGPAAAAAAG
jgi:peptidoglycan/LPS O-acetylase OafA/YrhL